MNAWDKEDLRWARTSSPIFQVRELSLPERNQAQADGHLKALVAGWRELHPREPGRTIPVYAAVLSLARRYLARDYVARCLSGERLLWKPLGEEACLLLDEAEILRMMTARNRCLLEKLRERPEICGRCGGKMETGTIVFSRLWAEGQWVCLCQPCHSKVGSPDMEMSIYARPCDWGPEISYAALKRMKKTQSQLEYQLEELEKARS